MARTRIGILGCGAIAPAYLKNLTTHFAGSLEVIACADLVPALAEKQAAEFGIPRACQPKELLADPEIEIVLNLTPAPAHHTVSLSVLRAGKHLFTEKPLALSLDHGREILEEARQRKLRIAGAADTFLGGSLQMARRLIDEGAIGTPVAAHAFVSIPMRHSERYHTVFNGPLLDLGPYYLTALVALLGPVARVAGSAEIRSPEKTEVIDGKSCTFRLPVPSTASATLDFADGSVATLITSCDVYGYYPKVEIHGTRGFMILNDANNYGGTVTVKTHDGETAHEPTGGFCEKGRGLGVLEMAEAIRAHNEPRADGTLLMHLLEIMNGIHESSRRNRHLAVETQVERPAAFDYASLVGGSA